MGIKKIYYCKICNRPYQGYRKSNTCSRECAEKAYRMNLEAMLNPSSKEYQERKKMGIEYKRQFERKKGKWFEAWIEGIKRAISGLKIKKSPPRAKRDIDF